MWHAITAQCKKYICSPYFLLCVICAAVACFFDVGLQTDEASSLTVLECVIQICRGKLTAEYVGCSVPSLLLNAGGESFSMLIPILVSLSFALPVCVQRQGGNLRFILHRTGLAGYCVSGLVAASITGGLVMTLGTLLYGVCLLPFFPLQDPWGGAALRVILGTLVQKLAGMFLLGASGVLPAYLISFFTTNLYLVLCIPFLLRYLMAYSVNWLGVLFFDALNNPLHFLTPGMVQSAAYGSRDGLLSLLTTVVVGAVCCLAGGWYLDRRADCGE